MTDAQAGKRAAAAAALELVRPGMKLGLGSGTTSAEFVALLGARARDGLEVRCAATSEATASFAADHGLLTEDLDALAPLDLTVDGADEIDPDLNLIKGGGGALFREKIVAQASGQVVIIADASKRVARLGACPLPVEVGRFGHETTRRAIVAVLEQLGLVGEVAFRRDWAGEMLVTDGGNYCCDCHIRRIDDPQGVATALGRVAGVVEHGLFVGMASGAIIGEGDGSIDRMGAVA